MVFVYCPRKSDSVRYLCKVGGFSRLWSLDKHTLGRGLLVNWGNHLPLEYIDWYGRSNILNPKTFHNKYNELVALKKGNVCTVPFSLQRESLDWLARSAKHTEANDLLKKLHTGDYYVQYVPNEREFRIHVFGGKSVRAGVKVPRVVNPNPNFRSWSAGWKLDYGNACQEVITKEVRRVALAAIEAVGYDFGAVDVGLTKEDKAFVFEVNASPGLEGNTVETYVRKIKEISENES